MSSTNVLTAATPTDFRPHVLRRLLRDGRAWLTHTALAVTGLLVLLVLWSLAVRSLEARLPLAALFGPGATLASLQELLANGELNADIIASLRRVGVSLVLALAAGIPVGLAVGSCRLFAAGSSASFQFLRMISPLSWMPIAVMAFGIGDAPIYFLLAVTAVWPVILNTAAGVRQLDRCWLTLGRSLSATRTEMLLKIVLPGVLGHILAGVRIAIGMIWILLVPCEMLGVTSGLGYFVLDTRDRLAYSELMAVVLFIGLLGWLLDSAAQGLHRRWARR